MKVEIPRAKDCSVRIATLTIRYATLTIKAPANSQLQPITVNVIWACEDNPSDEVVSPVSWLLLTTLPTMNSNAFKTYG